MNAKKRRAPSTGARTKPERLAQVQRVARALEQRAAGWSLQRIAEAGGWRSRQAVHDALSRALAATLSEPAEAARQLDVERLDALIAGHFPPAISGDPIAAGIVLRTLERRARLLGLDEPTRAAVRAEHQFSGGVLVVPAVLSEAAWLAEAAEQQDALLAAERSVWSKAGGSV